MPTAIVLLPSTTYRASDFIRAAEGLGIDLIVASEQPPPFDMGDRYLQVDCSDPELAAEAIVRLGDRSPIDGIVAADDGGVVAAAIAGDRLGLKSNDPDAAAASRDKSRQRRLLQDAEVPQPRFVVLEPEADAEQLVSEIGYPAVVKPLDRAAGQGVIRVDDEDQLSTVLERVRAIVGETAPLIAEEMMGGEEVAVEGIVRDGELTILAIFDKPDTGEGPFFPETILVTPSRLPEDLQTECRRVAAAALAAIGIGHGPVHVELKVEGEKVRVIEVAARSIGGLCSRSLNFGLLGTTLEALILRNAVGMEKPELRREPLASGVLMIPIPRAGRLVAIEGLDEVRSLHHVTSIDITAPVGTSLLPPPEGDRYLGFVFARGPERDGVEADLRRAQELIRLVVE